MKTVDNKKTFRQRVGELYERLLARHKNAELRLVAAHAYNIYDWLPRQLVEVKIMGSVLKDMAELLDLEAPALTEEEARTRLLGVESALEKQIALLRNKDFQRHASLKGKRRVNESVATLSARFQDIERELEALEIVDSFSAMPDYIEERSH